MAEARVRIAWIDALRCLAILMVVAAHSISEVMMYRSPGPGLLEFFGGWIDTAGLNNIPYNLIASVYMPLFAFVSGVAQGRGGLRLKWPTVGKRVWQLMVPYFAWLLVTGVLFGTIFTDFPGWLRGVGIAAIEPRSTGLWFLYAIFVVQVAVAAVTSLSARPRTLVVTALGMVVLMMFLRSNLMGVRDLALLYPFFVMGMLQAHTGFLDKRRMLVGAAIAYPLLLALVWPTILEVQRWWLAPAGAFLDGLPGMPWQVAAWTVAITLNAARYGCAAAGIALLYHLYTHLPATALAVQVPVGQRTIGIYAIHYHFIRALVGAGVSSAVIVFAISAAVSFVITLALERVPVLSTVLLGKPPRAKTCAVPVVAEGASG